MRASDFQIRNHEKLDNILVKLCELVIDGQKKNPAEYGMVAATVLDPDNNCVVATSYNHKGKWTHAEKAAMENYHARFGDIPEGSIILTTLTPCSQPMHDRYGSSCEDLIDDSVVHKVYCGYEDPTQPYGHKKFHTEVTRNKKIQTLCKAFADTFLKDELNELSFLGSPCTKDCSGHRAGYAWSERKGGRVANSPWSPSFNKGSQLQVDGK